MFNECIGGCFSAIEAFLRGIFAMILPPACGNGLAFGGRVKMKSGLGK